MARGKLDDDGFSRFSKKLGEDTWFYEGRRGLTIAHTARGTLQDILSTIEIPWHKLAPVIERYQKFKRRSKSKRRTA